MAKTANQLTVARSDVAAETIAAVIWDLTTTMDVASAQDASAKRMLQRHARELCDLHDELDADKVLRVPYRAEGNGSTPHGMPQIPAHAEG